MHEFASWLTTELVGLLLIIELSIFNLISITYIFTNNYFYIFFLLLACVDKDGITKVADAVALGLCSRASSAPTGKIDIVFSELDQIAIVTIVPVYPKTMVKLTCGTIKNADVGTVSIIFTFYNIKQS